MKFSLRLLFVLGVTAATGFASPSSLLWKSNLHDHLVSNYETIAKSPLSTGVLYDLVVPFSGLTKFDGRPTAPASTISQWRQMIHELDRASLAASTLPDQSTLRELGRTAARERVYPLGMLYYHYQHLREGIPLDSAITFDGQQITDVRPDAFESSDVFAVAPLQSSTYRGAEARFQVDLNTLYFSIDPRPIQTVEADFDDGLGFRTVSQSGEVFVQYAETGRKILHVRVTFSDGTQLEAQTTFDVLSLRTPDPSATWTMQSSVPYNGEFSSGDAYVYLGTGHSDVTNPVVVAEGFDYDNTMNWDALYNLLNQQELLETMKAMGFDAVVLNYHNPVAPIQGNAYLVEALVDTVNQIVGPAVSPVLIGASMGGLTTRYALTHMEANSQPHQIRTWLSFDAPHRGANIPLGLQYWVDFFAEESVDAAYLRDILNSPAARQMLVAHFTNPPSSVAASDPLFAAFFADLALIGDFPQLTRTVAVANGSGSQAGEPFGPAAQLIQWEYSSFVLDIVGNVWALPNSQSHVIFDGDWNMIWPFPDRYVTVNLQPTWPWDNAPGGWKNTMGVMDAMSPGYGDIIAFHPNHCFIPSISALDLAVDDPFHPIATDPDLYSLSPFDSLYFPVENQEHVAITPENAQWFLYEICQPLSSPLVVIKADTGSVRLNWHPIQCARSYQIFVTTDLNIWPAEFSQTSDTTWMDADLSQISKFYRVIASLDTLP